VFLQLLCDSYDRFLFFSIPFLNPATTLEVTNYSSASITSQINKFICCMHLKNNLTYKKHIGVSEFWCIAIIDMTLQILQTRSAPGSRSHRPYNHLQPRVWVGPMSSMRSDNSLNPTSDQNTTSSVPKTDPGSLSGLFTWQHLCWLH